MRILTVGAVKGGSVPIGRAIHQAFTSIGQVSHLTDYSEYLQELNFILLKRDAELSSNFLTRCRRRLMGKVEDFKPDMIFGMAQAPIFNTALLTALRNHGIVLCCWFVEDCRLFQYWRQYASLFDYFFLIQKEPYINQIEQLGCPNVHYLPTAFDANLESANVKPNSTAGVSFMGAPYANRIHYFKDIVRTDFEIYGEGWRKEDHPNVITGNRRISEAEARHIYLRTAININLHSSPIPMSFSNGDFVNPRTFELAGLGAFQLVDYRELLPVHFDPGSEITVFSEWDVMKNAIDYFLENEEERRTISERARLRVLKEHTYEQRALQILRILDR